MDIKIILCVVFFPLTTSQSTTRHCVPKYHFWRPFYGVFPNDAFIAAYSKAKHPRYIAKLIAPSTMSLQTPAQLVYDHIPFAWSQETVATRADKFIEVLSTSSPEKLKWVNISHDCNIEAIFNKRCMVEAGGFYEWETVKSIFYIGRARVEGKYYIGRVPSHLNEGSKRKMYAMDGWKTKDIDDDFEILTYSPLNS